MGLAETSQLCSPCPLPTYLLDKGLSALLHHLFTNTLILAKLIIRERPVAAGTSLLVLWLQLVVHTEMALPADLLPVAW